MQNYLGRILSTYYILFDLMLVLSGLFLCISKTTKNAQNTL